MSKKNNFTKIEKDYGFIFTSILVTIFIFALWLLTYFLLKDMPSTERGTLGDMFGTVNSLFSGLALAGIILTILLQRKELKLQREELSDTREEFKTQNETLKLQRFENTFFNLLNLHHQIVSGIDYRYYKSFGPFKRNEEKEIVIINGRDVFKYFYNEMKDRLSYEDYTKHYLNAYENVQTDFGHYFRNLYRMIKLVDETNFTQNHTNELKKEEFKIRYQYICIIRSQISDYELLWLFYNCLSNNGIDKFKPLIEKYSFFKNLPRNLISNETHIDLYSKRAFNPKE